MIVPRLIFPVENESFQDTVPACFDFGDYVVEIHMTIYRGRRVVIRERGAMWFMANWCAGPDMAHCERLMGLAFYVLEHEIKYPPDSKVKPYHLDNEFTSWMESLDFKSFPLHDYLNYSNQ